MGSVREGCSFMPNKYIYIYIMSVYMYYTCQYLRMFIYIYILYAKLITYIFMLYLYTMGISEHRQLGPGQFGPEQLGPDS